MDEGKSGSGLLVGTGLGGLGGGQIECLGLGDQIVEIGGLQRAGLLEDDLALLASVRECTKNGVTEPKEGFYQYSVAWDSKHKVALEDGKSARVLFELQQMTDGANSV